MQRAQHRLLPGPFEAKYLVHLIKLLERRRRGWWLWWASYQQWSQFRPPRFVILPIPILLLSSLFLSVGFYLSVRLPTFIQLHEKVRMAAHWFQKQRFKTASEVFHPHSCACACISLRKMCAKTQHALRSNAKLQKCKDVEAMLLLLRMVMSHSTIFCIKKWKC